MKGVTLKLDSAESILGRRGLSAQGEVQRFVDSEVLRLSDPYVPMDTGHLKNSGILGTKLGSGQVVYNAPYARSQYYGGRQPGKSETGALRGRLWFDRMKADHKEDILRGAKKLMGGEGR